MNTDKHRLEEQVLSAFIRVHSRPRNAGVTLIEMMVVVTIIAMLAGVSYPSVSSGIDSVRLRSATDSVATFLNAAVVRAERRQEPMELVISPKTNELDLFS